ncbi:reverse transcriptase domain-containing protein [uncultured Photobacterium sp.]|uniref:reverse transcriptase domain-containing protein n=1 Tax=uncultured Photobacterium sp. TaxID=173973 RepID=UPI002627C2D0|nr:reverse transcriptase domain-containing protein [uncultured Photobacterium sp.]
MLVKNGLKEFFPSIKPDLFFKECRHQGIALSDLDKDLLEGVLFWKTRRAKSLSLSIGAPSSPLVFNFILYRFDNAISQLCQSEGIVYTRYADDLTFSTNKRGAILSFPPKVRRILGTLYDGNIKINLRKTVLSSKAHNRHVTGITLTNDGKLNIGREEKRKLSAAVYRYASQMLELEEILVLRGKLSYATFLEPEFLERLIRKYGQQVKPDWPCNHLSALVLPGSHSIAF